MSKSYGNTINIFDEGKGLKKKVMSIETDSTPLDEPIDPDTCNVFALIKLFASKSQRDHIAAKYRAGGYGYGHAKKELLGFIEEYFAEAREKRKALAEDQSYLQDVLQTGGKRARERAEEVMEPIRSATGLFRSFDY
jgi:tryptophanyl-tRNA synthetase